MGEGERALGRHKLFLLTVCVCWLGVWSGGGGGMNSSLGPLAKTPVGLNWQPHEAAWQEESCI